MPVPLSSGSASPPPCRSRRGGFPAAAARTESPVPQEPMQRSLTAQSTDSTASSASSDDCSALLGSSMTSTAGSAVLAGPAAAAASGAGGKRLRKRWVSRQRGFEVVRWSRRLKDCHVEFSMASNPANGYAVAALLPQDASWRDDDNRPLSKCVGVLMVPQHFRDVGTTLVARIAYAARKVTWHTGDGTCVATHSFPAKAAPLTPALSIFGKEVKVEMADVTPPQSAVAAAAAAPATATAPPAQPQPQPPAAAAAAVVVAPSASLETDLRHLSDSIATTSLGIHALIETEGCGSSSSSTTTAEAAAAVASSDLLPAAAAASSASASDGGVCSSLGCDDTAAPAAAAPAAKPLLPRTKARVHSEALAELQRRSAADAALIAALEKELCAGEAREAALTQQLAGEAAAAARREQKAAEEFETLEGLTRQVAAAEAELKKQQQQPPPCSGACSDARELRAALEKATDSIGKLGVRLRTQQGELDAVRSELSTARAASKKAAAEAAAAAAGAAGDGALEREVRSLRDENYELTHHVATYKQRTAALQEELALRAVAASAAEQRLEAHLRREAKAEEANSAAETPPSPTPEAGAVVVVGRTQQRDGSRSFEGVEQEGKAEGEEEEEEEGVPSEQSSEVLEPLELRVSCSPTCGAMSPLFGEGTGILSARVSWEGSPLASSP